MQQSLSRLFSRYSASCYLPKKTLTWGFPKIRGTFLGFLIIRTIVFWGPYWGPLILENYDILTERRFPTATNDFMCQGWGG